MKVSFKLILQLIEESNVGFNNAKTHEGIKEKLSGNYSEADLDELLKLTSELEEKFQDYEKYYGQQLEATTKLNALYKSELYQYSSYRQAHSRLSPKYFCCRQRCECRHSLGS